jgi:ferric-dicitrate binding protein FerR (iron transport regulator)
MSEEIFVKILNGSATKAEKSSFYQELEENSELRQAYFEYKTIYTIAVSQNSADVPILQNSLENFRNRLKPAKRLSSIGLWYRYAAIFVVALGVGFLVHYLIGADKVPPVYTHQMEYTSEKGSVSVIHLKDGSAIWLSSGSKIIVSSRSTGEMTAVLNGEAYFDMVPDPNRNFTVDLGYFKVKDIGTKFDIRAYHDEMGITASLADGQIDFSKNGDQPIVSLKPGEYMQFDKETNHLVVSKQDPTIATAWKDGKFVFIHKTLAEICHELESWYNVQIVITNPSLANTRYTSVIKRTTTVKLVMKMLSLTDNINYKITDRKEAKDIVYIY